MTDRTVYSTDDDLVKIRPNILQLGVDDWTDQHEEAFRHINQILNAKWYRMAAGTYNVNNQLIPIDWETVPFDPDKVDITQVRMLSSYKTLELAYLHLMKDDFETDPFEKQSQTFAAMYRDELANVLGIGLNYDWDDSGSIEEDEKFIPKTRRLIRV